MPTSPFLQLIIAMLPLLLEILKKPTQQAREDARPYWESVAKAAVKSGDPWAMMSASLVIGTLNLTDEQVARLQPSVDLAHDLAASLTEEQEQVQ